MTSGCLIFVLYFLSALVSGDLDSENEICTSPARRMLREHSTNMYVI